MQFPFNAFQPQYQQCSSCSGYNNYGSLYPQQQYPVSNYYPQGVFYNPIQQQQQQQQPFYSYPQQFWPQQSYYNNPFTGYQQCWSPGYPRY